MIYLNWCGTPACAGVKCFGDSPLGSSSLRHFITCRHLLAFLLLLVFLLLWVVHTDSELSSLCAVLVLDQEGVFARVRLSDGSDCDAGELPMLKLEVVVVIAHQLLVILSPAHLRHGVSPHVSSQIQGLRRKGGMMSKTMKMTQTLTQQCEQAIFKHLALLDCNHIWQASNNTGAV